METRHLLAGALLATVLSLANAADSTNCTPWVQAESNLKLHGYKIVQLSRPGVERVLAYLAERSNGRPSKSVPDDWTGYYASTRFYFYVDSGVRAGGMPDNRAVIVLATIAGECLAQMGGTIEQMEAILDGSAARLNNSLAR
ncbi:hypothetical protein ACQ858_08280 [Variovorax ureilyticus]|uniref:hypothetical protein n=1 Tax=Variovorax ureilyticus TaxID=1836198 RepID=UPI003D669D0F